MNNKIYFNQACLHFIGDEAQVSHNQSVNFYEGTYDKGGVLSKALKDFVDHDRNIQILIRDLSFDKVLEELKKDFVYIEAAGGFIEQDGKFLFIHRHKRWDLPKGKLNKGESNADAAIRECEEECGISELSILAPLSPTFHLYPYKGKMALKQTYWYHMNCKYRGKLVPQTEEDIDKVEWFSLKDIHSTILPDTYFTIQDVVREGLKL
ncbi:MAG TPA: NUDIX domain-containing protein [Bacteroidia bacterium]|nr:NUDIX domain-containing protein [Bacteroidia bacterium]